MRLILFVVSTAFLAPTGAQEVTLSVCDNIDFSLPFNQFSFNLQDIFKLSSS